MTMISDKQQRLMAILACRERLGVAFSGGVDSTVLLVAAHRVLGDRVVAFTANSPIHPQQERDGAIGFAADAGLRLMVVDTDEWQTASFVANTAQRCYLCKKILFARMAAAALPLGIATLAHGATMDDLDDYRPGMRAAAEMGVAAPLVEAGLTKADVREMARSWGLAVWNRPSMACLATRIAYGQPITVEALALVAAAENFLTGAGFSACRVRLDGFTGHIEVPPDQMARLLDPHLRAAVVGKLRGLGLLRVTLDLEGYVGGKMNRWIETSAN